MITLTTSGNSIYFQFEDNPHYLQNGVIEAPKNSLILVTDNSAMATFKKVDGDVFLSALYSELGKSKSELETWFAENAVGSTGGVDPEDVLDIVDESTNYIDSVDYVSSANTINFYHGEEIVDSIDTSDFVIDGMIEDVRIETISGVTYLVIDFNTASGKEDIQIPLTDIFDPSNYYTKAEVDNAISAATDDMATQTWVEDKHYITGVDLSDYATEEFVNASTSGKADTSAVTAVNNVLTAHTADTTIHVTSADKTAWNAKSDFSGSYNDLTDKPTIPTVPTNVSAFNNDAGYATSGYVDSAVSGKQDNAVELTQAEYDALVSGGTVDPYVFYIITDAEPINLSGYAQSSAVTAEIAAAVSGKADTSAVTASINAAVSGKVDSSSIVTAVTSASTDSQIPTAKAVFDAIPSGGTSITIDPTLDSGSTNPVANSAITTALNDTVKLSKLSTYYINGFTNYVNRTIPIFHRFNVDNQSNGNAWWFGKINNKYVIKAGGESTQPSDLMDLQVVETSAVTSAVTSASTDSQIPTAKAVFDAIPTGSTVQVSSAITSGDTNAVAGGAVYDKFDEVEQVTAAALNNLNDKFGGLKLQQISQSDYDALSGNTDSHTLYIIVN